MSLDPDDPRHGTSNGYRNAGCRCSACREANRIDCKRRRDRAAASRTCPICFGPGGCYADHRCRACYTYKRRTGHERPLEISNPDLRMCSNCEQIMPSGKPLRGGRCEACARYWSRNGRERPIDLILRHGTIL